jgi:hypothetical protein
MAGEVLRGELTELRCRHEPPEKLGESYAVQVAVGRPASCRVRVVAKLYEPEVDAEAPWRLCFERDDVERPRYLAADSSHGYAADERYALRDVDWGPLEALSEYDQALVTRDARDRGRRRLGERIDEALGRARSDDERLAVLAVFAAESPPVDVRGDLRAARFQLSRGFDATRTLARVEERVRGKLG